MNDSQFPGFYRQTINDRIDALVDRGFLAAEDAESLRLKRGQLPESIADKMTENVISIFGLPFSVAPNFLVNGKNYVVPMVVEEPSIVAGVSGAARLMRKSGGFQVTPQEPILIGQVQLTRLAEPDKAVAVIQQHEHELLAAANRIHPNLVQRGGGARSLKAYRHGLADGSWNVVVHIAVDTRDAMGANLVNTICEGLAPDLEAITGGTSCLRILSNLADQALVTASVTVPLTALRQGDYSAEHVRDGIVSATALAQVDPYRAATHNKGIMNGIDAVAIATGNDWRAIEASAHAFACRNGSYRAMSSWQATAAGDLRGELTLPLKVGIVGGSLQSNPGAAIGLRIAAPSSAGELAQLMCAVGLAQNFAALRALVSSGIQKGHMSLHARGVASAAGAPQSIFDQVVAGLIDSGDVKDWKARQLIAQLMPSASEDSNASSAGQATACGKVILLGEHAVVYGSHAVALPLANAVRAVCRQAEHGSVLRIPDWGIAVSAETDKKSGAGAILALLLRRLAADAGPLEIEVSTRLPVAMGLGSSAALAVAVARAIAQYQQLELADEEINRLAFDCEKLSHGNPSGIDNTIAVYGQAIVFQQDMPIGGNTLQLAAPVPLVIGYGDLRGSTKEQVTGVRRRYERRTTVYDAIFSQIDRLSIEGATALQTGDYVALGESMNICHGLLNALGVSTIELEEMVSVARKAGALGAKLTGAGGGGSIVALCPGAEQSVVAALEARGFNTLVLNG